MFLWRGKRRILRSRINGNDGEEEDAYIAYEYINAYFVTVNETRGRTVLRAVNGQIPIKRTYCFTCSQWPNTNKEDVLFYVQSMAKYQ